jgi:predicted anti-sigma-YlaC factor YlaD
MGSGELRHATCSLRISNAYLKEALMRLGNSPASLLLIAAVILFLLAAFGVDLGTIAVVPLGLAALSASFLFGGGSKLL